MEIRYTRWECHEEERLMRFVMRMLVVSLLVVVLRPSSAEVRWPTDADAVKELSHVRRAPFFHLALRSEGTVRAAISGVVSFVRREGAYRSVVEIVGARGMRISYINIKTDAFVGKKVLEDEAIGGVVEDAMWFFRAHDGQNWIDPLLILPTMHLNNTFVVQFDDFSFEYIDARVDSHKGKVLPVKTAMPKGRVRISMAFRIREAKTKRNIVYEYLFVQVGARIFRVTREHLLPSVSHEQDVTVSERAGWFYFSLPPIEINKKYYDGGITVRGPLHIREKFEFSIRTY